MYRRKPNCCLDFSILNRYNIHFSYMKNLIFLPDTLSPSNQLIELQHPSLNTEKSIINLVLSNREETQDVFWLQETEFGKSPEGVNLTVKSAFFNNTEDVSKGGILPNASLKFCTSYDLSFSIIAYFFKDNKLDFIAGKEESNKYETLNDIHLSLYEKSHNNWKFIKTNSVKESLVKFCSFIEEDHGEGTKELFFKITKDNFISFIKQKLCSIAENFPDSVMKKILEKYPTLETQEINIKDQAKLFFSLELLTSLLPFEVYMYLNKEFRESLYRDFIQYKEIDNVLADEQLKEEQLLLQLAKNVGSAHKNPKEKKPITPYSNSNNTGKKRKTDSATGQPKKAAVGALDSFFKPKK